MRRGIAAVVLSVSAAVAALLPVADAYAELAAAPAQSHVEQPGNKGCPPAHDEIACQLCRTLRLNSSSGLGTETLLWLETAIVVPSAPAPLPPLSRLAPSTSPRAPPVA